MKRIIELRCTCAACPEQWEGKLETGESLYARERSGWMRVDLDEVTIHEEAGEDVLDLLGRLFRIACKPEY